MPWLYIRRLHELLRQLGCGVSACFLHSRDERLWFCKLCAFLRLLLPSASDCFELRRGVDVVKLGSELYEAVETCEVELICDSSAWR